MNTLIAPNTFTYNAALSALDECFYTPAELAARWRTHASTFANKRAQGVGLRFTKIDGKVLYRMSDIIRAELDGCVDVGLPRVLDKTARAELAKRI